MKKVSLLAAAAIMIGLTACSTEEPVIGDQNTDSNSGLHAKIQLYLPTATRSATMEEDDENIYKPSNSEDGFEIGQEDENNVGDVIVLLATKDDNGHYTPVTVSTTSNPSPALGSTNDTPIFTILFREDEIVKAAGKEVSVFAFCNAQSILDPDDLKGNTTAIIDRLITLTNENPDAVWKSGSFLMANAPGVEIPSKVLPDKDALEKNFNTPEKALDLGIVDVARVAARFDFKQINNNVYPVNDANDNTKRIADVEILAMAPINIAKEFYLLPRVSNDGTDAGWTLCGKEHRNNWVVSPYWNDKNQDLNVNSAILGKYFYQTPEHVYTDESYFNFTYLKDFTGRDDFDENWGNAQGSGFDKTGYKIWRYVTENTLPAIASQKKGISTGVLFKAEIKNPAEGTVLAQTMAAGKDIYSYQGTMYGDVVALRKVAADLNENSPLRKAFIKVFGSTAVERDEDGNFIISDQNIANSEDNRNTFKIYRATKDASGAAHYYVYYLYRNRHQDNGNNNVMGAMEFGTVRNNIYKLSITSISDFGHTGDPGDDPDQEDPDDPDEEPKTYLKVSCRVVPWMVRVNNIEF